MIADGLLRRLQRVRPLRSPQGVVSRPSAPRRRGVVRPAGTRRRALPRPRPRVVLILLVLLLPLGGGWLWLRDSSLVAVQRVSVTGESGPDAGQIRSALVAAARNMTTLDVHIDQLRTAVAPFPVVKDLRVSTQFPHGLRIRVIEQIPVGAIVVDGRAIAVAGDGTLLHDVLVTGSLPSIPLRVPPGGSRLSDPDALAAVQVLAAAPYQLLSRVSQVTSVASHGVVAQLRNGPSIYFGDATRLGAKWTAAAAVLDDPGSAGAVYIDVTYPERPAAGASAAGASAIGASATSSPAGASAAGASATGASAAGASATGASATSSPAGASPTGGGSSAIGAGAGSAAGTTSTTPAGG